MGRGPGTAAHSTIVAEFTRAIFLASLDPRCGEQDSAEKDDD
jgi:hypothetical protein